MCCVCDVIVTDRWYPLKHQVSSCAPKPILFPHTWPSARALLRGVLSTAMDTPQTPSGHRKQMGLWPPPGSQTGTTGSCRHSNCTGLIPRCLGRCDGMIVVLHMMVCMWFTYDGILCL